jgi:inner membrane protein
LILSALLFYNPLLIALSIIGANLPDFDHKFKKDNVYKMIIFGLLIFIILYISDLPYFIGIVITTLGVIFYFSNHRGFTHSIFGLIILTGLSFVLIVSSYEFILNNQFIIISNHLFVMVILIALFGVLTLNKRLYLLFLPIFLISLFFISNLDVNYINIFLSIFLGVLSHLILDSFTPSGIKLFSPLSSKKVHKKFGLFLTIILFLVILINFYFNFAYLTSFFNTFL